MLSTDRISQQQFKSRTSVVDPKFPDMQRALSNSASKVFDNKYRCIQEKLGCILSGDYNRRETRFIGTKTSYKCSRNEGSKSSMASTTALSQEFGIQNKEFGSFSPFDQNYSRASSKIQELGSMLTVKNFKELFRVELLPKRGNSLSDHCASRLPA